MATKTGAKKHTHKYFKSVHGLWACGWPDCTHYMPTNVAFMMEGRASVCWICNERMLLSHGNLRQERPHCQECTDKAVGFSALEIEALIQRRIEQNAKSEGLKTEQSKHIINKIDSDCMTPDVCVSGNIASLCDNCREKLMY